MRTPLVAGNWKLNGTRERNASLVDAIVDAAPEMTDVEFMVCPPFVYVAEIASRLADTPVLCGAQNVAAESSGAFTGEVSATMLRDVGKPIDVHQIDESLMVAAIDALQQMQSDFVSRESQPSHESAVGGTIQPSGDSHHCR